MSLKDISFQVVDKKKTDGRKTFYSMWHVTVNSNCKGNDSACIDSVSEALKAAMIYTFKDRANESFRIDRPGDNFDSSTIDKIKISQAAEKGEDPKGGGIHVHAMVEVKHHTILQINRGRANELIRAALKDNPYILNPYVNIAWVPVSKKALEDYIGKNPLTRAGSSFQQGLLHNQDPDWPPIGNA